VDDDTKRPSCATVGLTTVAALCSAGLLGFTVYLVLLLLLVDGVPAPSDTDYTWVSRGIN
jgi:hypothetical protein